MKLFLTSCAFLVGLVSQSAFCDVKHGVNLELNHGVGYTLAINHFWGGFNVYGYSIRNGVGDRGTQLIVAPKVFINYDFAEMASIPMFIGFSWADNFGLEHDDRVAKHRVAAFPIGLHTKIAEHLELAGWANILAGFENINYDATTNSRTFDENTSRKEYFGFGGVSGTYYF